MSTTSGDLFPPSPRVLYRKAPLLQVICQLRFPPILRIEGELPAEFQERIRKPFPLFQRAVNPLLPQLPPEIVQALGPQLGSAGYQFRTEDGTSTIALTPESLSLSTQSYPRWERFREQLRLPLSALTGIYQPSFFTRIGLRYQNLINRERIGLTSVPWSRLFRKEILGELALKEFEENLLDAKRVLRINRPSRGAIVLLQHGLSKVQGIDELAYIIDFDFSSANKVEVDHAESFLDTLHEGIGRAFRWCITDELHNALEPVPLDDE
jgi:uncharacterized protein (TIGR04255 family)